MIPQVLLQGYYKRGMYVAVACPGDPHDAPVTEWWWDHLAANASVFASAGFTSIWLPPVTKAEQGISAAALGYSVFDDYDIGSKNQKATVHTRYGNREQLTRLVAMLRANGLDVYLDLQLNHRKGGSGPDGMTFEYADAYGNKTGGRFPKDARCFHSRYPADPVPRDFHPEIPQDPDVPAGIRELQMGSKIYFGPDLAHITAKPDGYVRNNVINNVQWLTSALDVQGYRIDHVQGISTVFLRELLSTGALQGKFAVGEYWHGDVGVIDDWVVSQRWMQGRCSAFDFPLYYKLLAMSNDPNFDMAELDHAGLTGINPMKSVTFVENHDTESRRDLVARNIQPEDKPLAYAYILTSEGLPCVFYKDYSTQPGCLGSRLRPMINNLIWIHQNIASGPTQQRWKDREVFVYERQGPPVLLVGLNRNKHSARRLQNVATGFGPHQLLHDYTGHAGDITTDANGQITLTLPRNTDGNGFVCYSVPGIASTFATRPASVTQVFEGAPDLDIKPAQAGATIRVCRLWLAKDSTIAASLTFDDSGWVADSQIQLSLTDPSAVPVATRQYPGGSSGSELKAVAAADGWHTFTVRSQGTPAIAQDPPYKLSVTYTATTG